MMDRRYDSESIESLRSPTPLQELATVHLANASALLNAALDRSGIRVRVLMGEE